MKNQELFASPSNSSKTDIEQVNVAFCEETVTHLLNVIERILTDSTVDIEIQRDYDLGALQRIKKLGPTLFTDNKTNKELHRFLEFAHSATKE